MNDRSGKCGVQNFGIILCLSLRIMISKLVKNTSDCASEYVLQHFTL